MDVKGHEIVALMPLGVDCACGWHYALPDGFKYKAERALDMNLDMHSTHKNEMARQGL